MFRTFLILSTAASFCMASFVPVSEYPGQHNHKCGYGAVITGARVNDKLYTFGGCYPIPYIINPENEDEASNNIMSTMGRMMGTKDSVNVSDTTQVYDFAQNTWSDETSRAPTPWRQATLQVVDNTIYAYSLVSRPASSTVAFWKYDVDMKEWSWLPDLPFIWKGALKSCERQGKIYFSGSEDGSHHNIIQIYNTKTSHWETPFVTSKKFQDTRRMACGKDEIHFFAKEYKPEDVDEVFLEMYDYRIGEPKKVTYTVFSSAYGSGITREGFNITGNFERVISQDESFYLLDIGKTNSTVSILNSKTPHENVVLESIPYTLEKPLIVPYHDEVFFFGGGEKSNFGLPVQSGHVNTIKKYNHKLTSGTKQEENSILGTDDTKKFVRNDESVKLVLQK